MMQSSILIFPSCMPRSIEYSAQAQREGISVIGASSLKDDFSKGEYPNWFYLPLISDDTFIEQLNKAVNYYNISAIYSPNPVIWGYLEKNTLRLETNINLVNESPVEKELYPYRQASHFYNHYLNSKSLISSSVINNLKLSEIQIKSIFRHIETIPGMCDHDKTIALLEIARYCPEGDIVEIGSWWGKSAFLFNQIARLYNIGNVLCVDPWDDKELIQHTELVDVISAQASASEAFDVFISNLLPYSHNVNYLKMTSIAGSKHYSKNVSIHTDEFGKVNYKGEIAILHIDGNHSLDCVEADINSWHKYVINNGWIIFDDYFWPYGDGPKIIGDRFLKEHENKIICNFVKGGALFVQIMKN